jgi:hypothetical protein
MTEQQPWAWAIVHSTKDVENRRTNIAGGYRGRVAIHAGKVDDDSVFEPEHPMAGLILRPCPHAHESTHNQYSCEWCSRIAPRRWLDQGHIVGVATLVDVHHANHCWNNVTSRLCSPWAEHNVWHLLLDERTALADPIPYRGMQGLTTLDAAIAEQLEQEWANR